MSNLYSNDQMLDVYIFETMQNIEQLESLILSCEKTNTYTQDAINEIFRIMHTIKGSSSMMLFNNISDIAHSIEDLFYYLREQKPHNIDSETLSDLVLQSMDFIKIEIEKIKAGDQGDGDPSIHIENIKQFLFFLKEENPCEIKIKKPTSIQQEHYYISPSKDTSLANSNAFKATLYFEEGCEMENIRAYTVIHNLKEITQEIYFIPEDIIENDKSTEIIKEKGFTVYTKTNKCYKEMHDFLMQTLFLKEMTLIEIDKEEFIHSSKPKEISLEESPIKIPKLQTQEQSPSTSNKSIISVSVEKLDKLMDLVGEMVIAEAMVIQNPDLKGLDLENFQKSARQLHKITNELQDMVMSIRMVPLVTTFHKMHRIVRDMSKKLGKKVNLKLIGEETEVDKNIIENISDPLMHLIRNSIDHGIEEIKEREKLEKPKVGTVILEAKNAGSDVLILIKDDGRGLNKEKILKRARENNLLTKNEKDMTDKEIYNLIFLPGFSTTDAISEFSGRGVGMDVVVKNLEKVGGSVSIDSTQGYGTTITLKIPLTLAIMDGMNVKVGKSRYTIPILSIKESFRPKELDLIKDPNGNEMIMVRGACYPILRIHEHFNVKTEVVNFEEGILIMVEQEDKGICIFVDELLGQQQVVVKALPNYIKNIKKIEGLSGCTLLGDGSISLILNISELANRNNRI